MPISKTALLPTRDGVGASCIWLPAESHKSLLDFLIHRFPHITADVWRARLVDGLVMNGAGVVFALDSPYVGGQHLYYYRHIEAEPSIPFMERILFEDEYLVVADKPHFLPVAPVGRYVQETLLTRLKDRLGLPDLAPLHRIDRETAGLVLFSKLPHVRDAYQALFRTHTIHKSYEAIAGFRPDLTFPYVYQSRMDKGEPFFRMQETEGTPNSETRIEILDQHGQLARYRLYPITGKQHQLRVHLASLGIAILYDDFYPVLRTVKDAEDDYTQPLQLLAREVRFTDPITGQPRHFKSERDLLAWADIPPG